MESQMGFQEKKNKTKQNNGYFLATEVTAINVKHSFSSL